MDRKKRWHIHSVVGFSCKEEGDDDTKVKLSNPGDYVKQITQISLDSLPLPLSCVGGGDERRRGLRSKGMGEQEQKKIIKCVCHGSRSGKCLRRRKGPLGQEMGSEEIKQV